MAIASVNADASVRVLRSLPELEEIRKAWESWPGDRESEMQSYLAFLRSNPRTARPHVVVVYRSGKPDSILVGRIDIGHITCSLGYARLNLQAKILCFVYGSLRGNPSFENCDLMVTEILRSLSQGEADVAYMNFLEQQSDLYRLARKKPGLFSRDYVCLTQLHFATSVPSSVEGFYKGLSSGARWQAKSKQKKLLKRFGGGVKVRCFREAAELETMLQDVEKVAQKSYQRGLGVGFVRSPETVEGLRFTAERGRLRGYVLYLEDRPCAFWLGEINDHTFGSNYLAYDAEFAAFSPGMFLIFKVMEGFCDRGVEGVTVVDFGLGPAQYKEVLANREWTETCVHIFAPTIRGISLNVIRTLIGRSDQAIKKTLSSLGILQKIKKVWRSHVRPQQALQS